MLRRLTLVATLAVTLATPAQPAGLLDMLWSWAASVLEEEPPTPPVAPTGDDDQGYSIDPDG